jgi:hypothetical protein
MWHNALLSGVSGKGFPKLERFLTTQKKHVNGVDEHAIMGWLKAYKERYKKEHGSSS